MAQNIGLSRPIQPRQDFFEWGDMEWRIDDSLAPGTGMSVAVMNLLPGKSVPLHRHPNCSELLYVQEGEVELHLDDRKTLLKIGDSALSPKGSIHGVENHASQTARLLLSYSAGKRIYEEV